MKLPRVISKNTTFRYVTGGLLILLGVIGIILPLAPGVIFLVLGLEVLGLRRLLTVHLESLEKNLPDQFRNSSTGKKFAKYTHEDQKSVEGPGGSSRKDLPSS